MSSPDRFYISFVHPDLLDDIADDDLDMIMEGEKLANWLAQVCADFPELEVTDEPIMEDWGWVVPVTFSGVPLVLGSYGMPETDGRNRAQMTIFFDALFPWTKSKRQSALRALSDVLPGFLAQQNGVSDLTTHDQPSW